MSRPRRITRILLCTHLTPWLPFEVLWNWKVNLCSWHTYLPTPFWRTEVRYPDGLTEDMHLCIWHVYLPTPFSRSDARSLEDRTKDMMVATSVRAGKFTIQLVRKRQIIWMKIRFTNYVKFNDLIYKIKILIEL